MASTVAVPHCTTIGPGADGSQAVEQGARFVVVRTREEFEAKIAEFCDS